MNHTFPWSPIPNCDPHVVTSPFEVNFRLPIAPAPAWSVTSSNPIFPKSTFKAIGKSEVDPMMFGGPVGLPCPCACTYGAQAKMPDSPATPPKSPARSNLS